MKNQLTRIFFLMALLSSHTAFGQMNPVGVWQTIDDDTGKPKGEVQIVDQGGVLIGKILKSLSTESNPKKVCEECKDDRKGLLIQGLEIIRGVKKETDELWAGGGKILDPENGKEYTVKLTPMEDGKKLRVRGYIGPFYRTQIWNRIQ
jgi:uncharacterized protein (DUF2147 family)